MAFGFGSRKNDGSWASGRSTSHCNNINLCICQEGMRKWLDKETVKEAELLSWQWTRVSPTTTTQPLLIACMQRRSQIRGLTMCPIFACFHIGKADYYFIQPVVREVRGNKVRVLWQVWKTVLADALIPSTPRLWFTSAAEVFPSLSRKSRRPNAANLYLRI